MIRALTTSVFCLMLSGAGLFLSACQLFLPEEQGANLERIQAEKHLVVGVKYDSKPFGYLDPHGELKGFDVDLSKELARRLLGPDAHVEFRQVLSSTRVIALNSRTVDMVAATMTVTPEREEVIAFTIPYYVAGQAVSVPKGSSIQTLEDLKGKIVLYALGATSKAGIEKVAIQDLMLKGFKSSTEAFSALKAGRGDAMTSDDTILRGLIAEDCGFRLLDTRLTKEPYAIALAKTDSNKSFIEALNKHITAMKADGTIEAIQKKWISFQARNCQGG